MSNSYVLSNRSNWQTEANAGSKFSEERVQAFWLLARETLHNDGFVFTKQDNNILHSLDINGRYECDGNYFVNKGKINFIIHNEVKKQGGQGNAIERACRVHEPGMLCAFRKKYKVYYPVLNFYTGECANPNGRIRRKWEELNRGSSLCSFDETNRKYTDTVLWVYDFQNEIKKIEKFIAYNVHAIYNALKKNSIVLNFK